MRKLVSVLLPLSFNSSFVYVNDTGRDLSIGQLVKVSFRNKERWGVVCNDILDDTLDISKVKPIISVAYHLPPISFKLQRLIDYSAQYTMSYRGLMLKMAIPVQEAMELPKPEIFYSLNYDFIANIPKNFKLTNSRIKVMAYLKTEGQVSRVRLVSELKVSASVLKLMEDTGVILKSELQSSADIYEKNKEWDAQELLEELNYKQDVEVQDNTGIIFNTEQKLAIRKLCLNVESNNFGCTLLQGVPGSGKTEVYFEAISLALSQGKQVLILLPEIALTSQWQTRFIKRFKFAAEIWHSNVALSRKKYIWNSIVSGKQRIVVGTRSALYLPFKNLGLIVIDEEHDKSFKQEESPFYSGRDMAVLRANFENIPIILVSATPSLESYVNVRSAKYGHIKISERATKAVMPRVEVIDLKKNKLKKGCFISSYLGDEIRKRCERGEQSLLFLNRRGYAPLTLCRTCGHRLKCPNCNSWLVQHRIRNSLECHYCGYKSSIPQECPSCEAMDSFAECGPGIERLEEELHKNFEGLRVIIASSDTMNSLEKATKIISQIENKEVDVIISTQILSKGYHFDHLTLIGIIDADLGLEGGDLRASEHTWQLLYQVAGRAGRAYGKEGLVILQTYLPDNQVMKSLASGAIDDFIDLEIEARSRALMPPFSRLVVLIFNSSKEEEAEIVSNYFVSLCEPADGITVWGPASPPLDFLRNRYRRRVLIQANRSVNVQNYIRTILEKIKIPKDFRIIVDIDPLNFM